MKKILLATLAVIASISHLSLGVYDLQETLESTATLDDGEFIKRIVELYPEIKLLTQETYSTPEGAASKPEVCLSYKTFSEYHPEFDRTMGGILAIKWLLSGDYNAFTKNQQGPAKLTEDNFNILKGAVGEILKRGGAKLNTDLLDVLIAFVALNDLGKVKEAFDAVKKKTKNENIDHDVALLEIFKAPDSYSNKFSTTFKRLSDINKNIILSGLGSELNIPQFVQAENFPANLTEYKNLDGLTRDIYATHFLFDVAGAASHAAYCSGGTIINNILFDSYSKAFAALSKIDTKSAKEVYDDYLRVRATAMGTDITTPENYALVKLAILNRAGSAKAYADTVAAFKQLTPKEQQTLITELNKDGIANTAILLYYAPALIVNSKTSDPANGLFIALRTMARLYESAKDMDNFPSMPDVYVVNIRELAQSAKNKDLLKEFGNKKLSIRQFGDGAEADILKYPEFTSKDVFETLLLDPRGKEFQKIITTEINKNPAEESAIVIADLNKFAQMAKELLPNNYQGERIALQTLARIYKAVRQQVDLPKSGNISVDISNFASQLVAWIEMPDEEKDKYKKIASQALAQFSQKNIVVEPLNEAKTRFAAKTTTMMTNKNQWFK